MIRSSICAVVLIALASPAFSQPPEPITSIRFSFPGSVWMPPGGAAAGTALADQWIGEEPAANPASPPRFGLALSPSLVRINRQDLASENRHFDQQAAFLDGAGAWFGIPIRSVALHLYFHQPVLRLEDQVYELGQVGTPGPSGVIESDASMRELRGGLALSAPVGPGRIGAAGEWVRRDDTYHVREVSGSPDAGERRVQFGGDAFGISAGARLDHGAGRPGAFTIGVGVRHLAALPVEGEREFALNTGSGAEPVTAERESGWEGGVSARVWVTAAFRVLAGAGGRTAQSWSRFDATSGRASIWSLGLDYRDAESPWTFRFGLGREQQNDVPEARASMVGIGFGWSMGETGLDVGVIHRSIERPGLSTEFDDRLVGTLSIPF